MSPPRLQHASSPYPEGQQDEVRAFYGRLLGFAAHPRHLCLEVTDVAAVRRRLETSGYRPHDGTPIPGRPRFFCRDPFGNLLEFTTISRAHSTRPC